MTPQTAPPSQGESLQAALASWASRAPVRRLEQLGIISTGLAAALLLLRASFWPGSAAALTLAALAGWGLLDRRRPQHPGRSWRVAEWLCAVSGTLFAILAGIGALFWVLSSGWSTVGG